MNKNPILREILKSFFVTALVAPFLWAVGMLICIGIGAFQNPPLFPAYGEWLVFVGNSKAWMAWYVDGTDAANWMTFRWSLYLISVFFLVAVYVAIKRIIEFRVININFGLPENNSKQQIEKANAAQKEIKQVSAEHKEEATYYMYRSLCLGHLITSKRKMVITKSEKLTNEAKENFFQQILPILRKKKRFAETNIDRLVADIPFQWVLTDKLTIKLFPGPKNISIKVFDAQLKTSIKAWLYQQMHESLQNNADAKE